MEKGFPPISTKSKMAPIQVKKNNFMKKDESKKALNEGPRQPSSHMGKRSVKIQEASLDKVEESPRTPPEDRK